MAGECVCHVNGYQVKDATARNELSQLKTDVRLARNEAGEARTKTLQIEEEVQSAREEAARAAAAAKTAYNTAGAALPKSGGTMTGGIDMGGKPLTNAVNLGGQVLFLENKTGGGEVTAEAYKTPGVVNFQHWKKPAPGDVILRGVADPVNDNDAATKKWVTDHQGQPPLVLYGTLDNEYPQMYLDNPEYGDEALTAILSGRQILVRTPNAVMKDWINADVYNTYQNTALFSPVLTYHLPNYENEYLYLFYLRDEKQTLDLSALGMGRVLIPVYGQLKMKLSEKYMECPLDPKTPQEYGDIILEMQ